MGGYMQQLIEAVNASNATTFLDWAPIILSVISVLIAVYIPVKTEITDRIIGARLSWREKRIRLQYSRSCTLRILNCLPYGRLRIVLRHINLPGESKVLKRRENCIAYTLKQVSAIGRFYQKQGRASGEHLLR